MVFDAKTHSMEFGSKTIIDAQHPPIIRNMSVKAAQGVLSRGLIVANDSTGVLVPYKKDYSQVIGTGAGGETPPTSFSGAITGRPVAPGSVTVTAGAVTLADDGNGNIKGTGGTGYINYRTGVVSVVFDAAPADGVHVVVAYANDPVGILTADVDTSAETVGAMLRHGTVVWGNVLVGVGAPAAADIAKLNAIGIY